MINLKNLPLRGLDPRKYSSPYGMRTMRGVRKLHDGIDYPAPVGTPIYAVADGTVEVSKMNGGGGGWGNYVMIDHGGFRTNSAHMHTRKIYAGSKVKAGQLIGTVGNTGNSTGPHLHFSIYINPWASPRQSIDPLPRLKDVGEEALQVKKVKMLIDGKIKLVDAVNIKNKNYVELRDLGDVIVVGYDPIKKLPIVDKRK